MVIPQSKNQCEPRYIANFVALEQTCRLCQLSGSGGNYFFQLAESFKETVPVMLVVPAAKNHPDLAKNGGHAGDANSGILLF